MLKSLNCEQSGAQAAILIELKATVGLFSTNTVAVVTPTAEIVNTTITTPVIQTIATVT